MKFSRSGILTCLLILAIFLLIDRHWRLDNSSDWNAVAIDSLPNTMGEWTSGESLPLDDRSHNILRLDKYLRRSYVNKQGERVLLYIGYWSKQSGDHQAAKHSPALCLPANGWKISELGLREVSPQLTVKSLSATLRQEKTLMFYWFFSGTNYFTDETNALLQIIGQTFKTGRSDGGIVEISTDYSTSLADIKHFENRLANFARELEPHLKKLLQTK